MGSKSYNEKIKRMLPADQLEKLRGMKFGNTIKVVRPAEGDAFLFMLKEDADYSNFFFKVKEFATVRNIQGYNCSYKPRNSANPGATNNFQPATSIDKVITQWAAVVAKYQVEDTIFDDPVIEGHKEWFSQQIQLVDDNLDEPFAVNQIMLILEHYEKLQDELRKLEGVPEEEVQELVQEIEKEKNVLGSISKRKSFDSMLNIWARVAKNYPTVLKFIIDTFNGWGLNKIFDSVLKSIEGG